MAEDFLAYLQKQAAKPSLIGPGTPGFASARLGRLSEMPTPPPPTPAPTPDSGGFLSGLPGIPEEGLGWGLLDILSRGNYAASNMFQEGIRDVRAGDPSLQNGEELGLANTIKAALSGFDEAGQAWQGFSGQQKITGANVVEDALGDSADEKGGFGKGAAALAIDIFGDPTSYIGAGLIKAPFRAAKSLTSAEKVATEAVDGAAEIVAGAAPKAISARTIDPLQKGIGTGQRALPSGTPRAIGDGGRQEAILRRMNPEGVYDVKGRIPMEGPGIKAFPDAERVDGAIPMGPVPSELPKPNIKKLVDDVPEEVVAKAPVEEVAKTTSKVPEVNPMLTTADLPRYGAFMRTADAAMPLPTGVELNTFGLKLSDYADTPGAGKASWVESSSTTEYARPGNIPKAMSQNVEKYSQNFNDLADTGPTGLKQLYKEGRLRPLIDTPAERALMNAVVASDLKKPAKDSITQLDFFGLSRKFKEDILNPQDGPAVLAKVFAGPNGNTAKDISAADLYKALHGEKVAGIDPKKTFIRTDAGPKVSVAEVVARNEAALSDPKFWNVAKQRAASLESNPAQYAERAMEQNITHLRRVANHTYDEFKEWSAEVKDIYPQISSKTLEAVYKAGKEVLDATWQRVVVGGHKTPDEFWRAQELMDKARNAQAEALASVAPPEELMTTFTELKAAYDAKNLNIDLGAILQSAAPVEAKLAAAKVAEETAAQIDETVAAAEKVAEAAPVERMAEAQGATAKVETKVRQVQNFNEISPSAKEVLDGVEWKSSITRDQAEGIVKNVVGNQVERMSHPKYAKNYNHIHQTNTLNDVLRKFGIRGSLEKTLKARGSAKSRGVNKLAGRVAHLIRATERQMDEAAGYTPNVWTGGSKTKPGYVIGEPGKVQKTKAAVGDPNPAFSSSKLMDDMLLHDAELVTAGGKADNMLPRALFGPDGKTSPLWTTIQSAAAFKDLASLNRIKDPVLRKYLLNYDAQANHLHTKLHTKGKVNAFTKAQEDAAQKHVAEAKLNDSPARAAKTTAETDNVAKEAIDREPSAPLDHADEIGAEAKDSAESLDEAMTPPPSATDAAVVKYKAPMAVALKDPKKLGTTNKAARHTQKAGGSKTAAPGQSVSNLDFNIPNASRLKTSLIDVGRHISTHAGQKYVRPIEQSADAFLNQRMTLSGQDWLHWGKALQKVTGGDQATMNQFAHSLNPANKMEPPPGTEELWRSMRQRMETVSGGSGVGDFIRGNSTMTRTGIPMERINYFLRTASVRTTRKKIKEGPLKGKYETDAFQFQGKNYIDGAGREYKYGEDLNWLGEWETAIPTDVTPDELVHFLHGVEMATQAAVSERVMFDDLAVRFGDASGKYGVDHPYLKGVPFHPEVGIEVKRFVEWADEMNSSTASSNAFLKNYDLLLRSWKMGVTLPNPVHHVKNAFGDATLGMFDLGVAKFGRSFQKSIKLMNKYNSTPDKFDTGVKANSWRINPEDTLDPQKLIEKITAPADEGNVMAKSKSGVEFDGDQIMQAAYSENVFLSAKQLEDVMDASIDDSILSGAASATPQSVKSGFGEGLEWVQKQAERREHSIRLAHFIGALEEIRLDPKALGMTKEQFAKLSPEQVKRLVVQEAGQRTRKWHPDGSDLTTSERKVARRLIPFYSWSRKSIPLILEGALRRPGVATAYPKMMHAITYGNSGETERTPEDQLFPNWMKEKPWAFVGTSVMEGGPEAGYTAFTGPGTPQTDLMPMLADPKKELLQMLTPGIKLPAELATGKQLGTGIPIDPNSPDNPGLGKSLQYVGKQVPFGGTTLAAKNMNKNPGSLDFMNWLLGAGASDSGEYVGSGYWDRQEELAKMKGRPQDNG